MTDSVLPEDSPAPSSSPPSDPDLPLKRRTTVILRDVDASATESDVLSLLPAFRVLSAKLEILNTWYVHMESEDQAKAAVVFLATQTLRGDPVKARLKGSDKVLRPGPPAAWQATSPLMTGAAAFVPAAYAQEFNGWKNAPVVVAQKFKYVAPAAAPAVVPVVAAVVPVVVAPVVQKPSQPRPANGTKTAAPGNNERRKKTVTTAGAVAAVKPAPFQPQDFPSLGGAAPAAAPATPAAAATPVVAAATVAPAPVSPIASEQPQALPSSSATSNSWASIAKKEAAKVEAPVKPAAAPAADGKKEKADGEGKKAESNAVIKGEEKKASKAIAAAAPAPVAPVVVDASAAAAAVSPAPAVAVTAAAATPTSTASLADSQEPKKRGWEQPGLPQVKKATLPSPPAAAATAVAAAPVAEQQAGGKSSKGKPTGARAKGEKNEKKSPAHASAAITAANEAAEFKNDQAAAAAVTPATTAPAWGTKSFAQTLKEAPAQPAGGRNAAPTAPAAQRQQVTAAPAAAAPASVVSTAAVVMLKANENWGDVEEDEQPLAPVRTVAARVAASIPAASAPVLASAAVAAAAPAPSTSSESSDDWRRDAAVRRKDAETRSGPVTNGGARRATPNGGSTR